MLLLLLTAAAVLLIFLLLRGKPEARRSRFLIGVCFFNLALFAGYKLSLSMDAAYVRAYYPNGFNLFNELPLHLCNINLFLIPIGRMEAQPLNTGICLLCGAPRRTDGAALPGAAVRRLSVVPAADLWLRCDPRAPCCLRSESGNAGLLPPRPKGYSAEPQDLWPACRRRALINFLLRLTLCPEANYFFTYGAEIGVLKLFWRIIPAPLLYGLPAPLILAAYMYAVCALSRLTQGEEEVSFS